MTFPLAGQKPTAEQVAVELLKLAQRGRRVSTSSASTGSVVGVLRLDDLQLVAGRAYKITALGHPDSSTVTDFLEITVRYSTDGSTPTTASSVIPGGQVVVRTVSRLDLSFPYVPGSDEVLSLLLCVARSGGSGNCTLYADATRTTDLMVEDIGPDVGDTGTDI